MTDKASDKSGVWFVRNVPAELRERVTAAAKARRQTVGELVTELLTVGLERLESEHQAVDQAVDAGELGERLEQVFREIERLSERVTALEGRTEPSERTGTSVAAKATDSPQKRSERQERPVSDGGALFVGHGAGRRLTKAGEEEVIRRHLSSESDRAIGKALEISPRTVANVVARTLPEPDWMVLTDRVLGGELLNVVAAEARVSPHKLASNVEKRRRIKAEIEAEDE